MRSLLILSSLCCITWSQSQNLVIDPGFEVFQGCPFGWGQATRLKHWTPDMLRPVTYYNRCSEDKSARIEKNEAGSQNPLEGAGYIGLTMDIYTKSLFNPDYSKKPINDFIMTKLAEPLVAGRQYKVSMYMSLADRFNYAANHIGARFSINPVYNFSHLVGDTTNYIKLRNLQRDWLDDKEDWIQVSGIYTAKGGEQYLIIGNGSKKLPLKKVDNRKNLIGVATKSGTYYFIDKVEVTATEINSVLPE